MHLVTDSKKLGFYIRYTRKAQKLTQEQLAAQSGVGVRFLRELEDGKTSCHFGKTIQVLDMLGLRVLIAEKYEADRAISNGNAS